MENRSPAFRIRRILPVVLVTVLLFSAPARAANRGNELRRFLLELIQATMAGTDAQKDQKLRQVLVAHPQVLVWWTDKEELKQVIEEASVTPIDDSVARINQAFNAFFRQELGRQLGFPIPLSGDVQDYRAMHFIAERFASLPDALRARIINLVPYDSLCGFRNAIDAQISQVDPAKFPTLLEISRAKEHLRIPDLSPRANETLVKLLEGYFRRMDPVTKKKIVSKILELPPEAPIAKRLSIALQASGPVLQKLFQLAGKRSRSEVLSTAVKDLLANIQPFSGQQAREILTTRLGRPLSEVFSSFDETPVAAATIGQTHRAVLKDTGQVVYIKIRRPGIKERMIEEIKLLRSLAEDDYARNLMDQLERTILLELDFKQEGHNLDAGEAYAKSKWGLFTAGRVKSMPVFDDVLVIHQAPGKKIDFDAPDQTAEQLYAKGRAIHRLMDRWLERSIFEDGFLHADLHEGNIFYDPARGEAGLDRTTLIDFGSAAQLSLLERKAIIKLLLAIYAPDAKRAAVALQQIAPLPPDKRAWLRSRIQKTLEHSSQSALDKLQAIINTAMDIEAPLPDALLQFSRGKLFLEGHLNQINKQLDKLDPQHHLGRFDAESTYFRSALRALAKQYSVRLLEGGDRAVTLPTLADFGGRYLYQKGPRHLRQAARWACRALFAALY